jgi:hypothetical protein
MALTKVGDGPHRWEEFTFYNSYKADGTISDGFGPAKIWKLTEMRIHFSTAFASAESMTIYLSSILGSLYNIKFYSLNVSGSTDIWWQMSSPLKFFSDDTLVLKLSMASGVNGIGFQFFGWSVVD